MILNMNWKDSLNQYIMLLSGYLVLFAIERQKKRDDKAVEKEDHPELDEYALKILSILRNADETSDVKYNSIYFKKLFGVANITILRSIKKLKKRTVWPFQLILDNGSVYLFAYSEYYDVVVLYDLNYLADVTVLNEEFILPEKYDIIDFSGGGRLGAFKSDKIDKFKIRFTGYAKDWIKEHKWADDQTCKEYEDSTTITFTSSQFEKVLELTLSWGHQAKPLAPARLIKRWKEEVLKMVEMTK